MLETVPGEMDSFEHINPYLYVSVAYFIPLHIKHCSQRRFSVLFYVDKSCALSVGLPPRSNIIILILKDILPHLPWTF